MPEANEDFYIGYLPEAPDTLARWTRARVRWIFVVGCAVALLLLMAQSPFSKAVFEFGGETEFEGWLELEPAPSLLVRRPGRAEDEPWSRYLLTVFGKHGAGEQTHNFDGKYVKLSGALIYRDDRTMIEIAGGTLVEAPPPADAPLRPFRDGGSEPQDLGQRTYVGEIVDSKCFLGVMKPGNLKPHRACATRCISGGVPPVLLVRDNAGSATYLLLTDTDGGSVGKRVLDMIAEPVKISGQVVRYDDLLVLRAAPSTYERLD